jgi:hypothetical protein
MTKTLQSIRHYPVVIEPFGVHITIVIVGEKTIFIPVAQLCKEFGISAKHQLENIEQDLYYIEQHKGCLEDLPVPTAGGMQTMKCLRKPECARWITKIDANRTKEPVRGRLEEVQQRLWEIADRLIFGDLSTVVADSLTTQFVRGELRLGACPRCRTLLALIVDASGAHLEIADA